MAFSFLFCPFESISIEAMWNERANKRPVGSRIIRLMALVVLAWIAGFVAFVLLQPRAAEPVPTDAVVVLTGGPGRLARGIEVLRGGLARRLLVSGVNPKVRPEELIGAAKIPPDLFACCVDLGFEADTTRANAAEVASWVMKNGYRSVRLVTAGYHIPRAEAELQARLPEDVQLVSDGVGAGLPLFAMLAEYAKFQVAWLRLRVRPA